MTAVSKSRIASIVLFAIGCAGTATVGADPKPADKPAASKPTPKEGFSMNVKAADGKTYKITSYPPLHSQLDVRDGDTLLGNFTIDADGNFTGINPNTMDQYKAIQNAYEAWQKQGGPAAVRERRKADTVKGPPHLTIRILQTDPDGWDNRIMKALGQTDLNKCASTAIKKDPKVDGRVIFVVTSNQLGKVETVEHDTDETRHGSITAEFIECVTGALQSATWPHYEGSMRSTIQIGLEGDVQQ